MGCSCSDVKGRGSSSVSAPRAENNSAVLFGGVGVGKCVVDVLLDKCGGDLLLARLSDGGGAKVNMGTVVGNGGEFSGRLETSVDGWYGRT